MRTDRLFSELGLLSRSECKKAVKAGEILINGVQAKAADTHIDPEKDEIVYRGQRIDCSPFVYYMLNKPEGVVTSRKEKGAATVFEFVSDPRPDIFAVGRLDKDTTGILLITNDGQLGHRLLSAKYHVPKTYIAKTAKPVTEEQLEALRKGVDIGDEEPSLPAMARLIPDAGEDALELTITEGRYHQVKRMLKAVGNEVTRLHRSAFGPLKLDGTLPPGQIRRLFGEEVSALKAAVERKDEND